MGRDKVDQLFGDPMYEGFFDFSDTILQKAIELPSEVVGQTADYVAILAMSSGNAPLAASAEGVSKAADLLILGSRTAKAIGSGREMTGRPQLSKQGSWD
jgi:hypothetical protein